MSEFKGTPGTLGKRANKRRFNIGDAIIVTRRDGSCERGIISGVFTTALREPYYWCRLDGDDGLRSIWPESTLTPREG